MAPVELDVDYYAVLEVDNRASLATVTGSYRRLAKIRHPDKNLGSNSTALFQSLQDAYDTISDPVKRAAYDRRWPSIRSSLHAQRETASRQEEAKKQQQKEDQERQGRLRQLQDRKSKLDNEIFELNRTVRRLEADLRKLRDKDDEDVRKQKERNSWWAYFTSPISGKVQESSEEKIIREQERLDRLASKRVKGSQLRENETRQRNKVEAVREVSKQITAEQQKAESQRRRREEAEQVWKYKKEQEARVKAAREHSERTAKAEREREERAAKAAHEARAAREAQEAQEARHRAHVAEAARRAAEERRQEEEAVRRRRSACGHKAYWQRVEGREVCGNCMTMQYRYTFECPKCRMRACAPCRHSLRGEKRRA